MRKIREVLRLKSLGLTNRQIAASVKTARSTVAEYLRRAQISGISWPLPENMDDSQLEKLLFPLEKVSSRQKSCPDFNYIHNELKRRHVTLALLWEEYSAADRNTYRYSHFCCLYRAWRKTISPSMRQLHRAGEKMFVDYAGDTVPVFDEKTGEIREAEIFVAVLGASNYTFCKASWSQDLPSWISSHVKAFDFFGGVPRIIVPDNLKSGVTKPCRYEPDINPTYCDMANHYETTVIPARVAKPKDKAKVESAVQIVGRWILARLRNRTFFSLGELNTAISEQLTALNNKAFAKLEGTRQHLFESIDKPALGPLPVIPYEFAEFRKARVNIDYHIEVDGHYYSVPYQLIRQEMDVRLTYQAVEVLFKGRRIAAHARSFARGRHTTDAEHRPASHRKYLEWTPSRIINWAQEAGPSVAKLAEAIMLSRKHPEWGYRSCLGLIRLEKSYSKDRLEAACRRALDVGALSYKSVKLILKNHLDGTPLESEQSSLPIPSHENIRGADYYH